MLHWQLANLKNLPLLKNVNVFAITSCIIHIILGLFLFVFSTSHQPDLNNLQVHANARNVKVRLVPFGRKKPSSTTRTGSNKKTAHIAKIEKSKKLEKKIKSTRLTAASKKLTQVAPAQKKKKNKSKKKQESIKQEQKFEAQKITPPKPLKPEQEKVQEIISEPRVSTPSEELQKIDRFEQLLQTTQGQDLEEEILYVSYQELEELQLGQALQEAVTGVWNPPAGMDDETECKVFIALNKDGKTVKTAYEKISGIRIYDATVERAITEIQFPHQLWGKSFTLCFKA